MGMDPYADIRIIALNNVANKVGSYPIRKLVRWFSREFSTPIHVVEDLPIDYILLQYYESQYENMSKEELDEIVYSAVHGSDTSEKDSLANEVEEYQFAKAAEEIVKRKEGTPVEPTDREINPLPAPNISDDEIERISMKFVDSIEGLEDALREAGGLFTEGDEDGLVGVK